MISNTSSHAQASIHIFICLLQPVIDPDNSAEVFCLFFKKPAVSIDVRLPKAWTDEENEAGMSLLVVSRTWWYIKASALRLTKDLCFWNADRKRTEVFGNIELFKEGAGRGYTLVNNRFYLRTPPGQCNFLSVLFVFLQGIEAQQDFTWRSFCVPHLLHCNYVPYTRDVLTYFTVTMFIIKWCTGRAWWLLCPICTGDVLNSLQ